MQAADRGVSVAAWQRVKGFERRFSALYAQWKAGTLAKARAPLRSSAVKRLDRGERGEAQSEGKTSLGEIDAARLRPMSLLPRGFAWLQKILPLSAGTLASMLGPLVHEHPEMKAFVAEVPRAGRLLRPICSMVGLRVPEWLALPRRKSTSRRPAGSSLGSRPRTVAGPPRSGGGDVKRRRRTPQEVAAAAMRRSTKTGEAIDPRKLSAAAYGCVLHMPRDGNCPPPEIGYGGRSFPPLPKDYVPPKD